MKKLMIGEVERGIIWGEIITILSVLIVTLLVGLTKNQLASEATKGVSSLFIIIIVIPIVIIALFMISSTGGHCGLLPLLVGGGGYYVVMRTDAFLTAIVAAIMTASIGALCGAMAKNNYGPETRTFSSNFLVLLIGIATLSINFGIFYGLPKLLCRSS